MFWIPHPMTVIPVCNKCNTTRHNYWSDVQLEARAQFRDLKIAQALHITRASSVFLQRERERERERESEIYKLLTLH